jgi:hypothetical protein
MRLDTPKYKTTSLDEWIAARLKKVPPEDRQRQAKQIREALTRRQQRKNADATHP